MIIRGSFGIYSPQVGIHGELPSSGTSKNMSRWKASAPGEYPVTCDTLARIACDAVDNASLTSARASPKGRGGCDWILVLITLATVWCIRSQIPFAVGLRLVVGTSRIPKSCISF